MSVLTEKETTELTAKAATYDYIRFTWPDYNGIPRGKAVPGRYAEDFIRSGVGEYPGTICMGPRTELQYMNKIECGYGNCAFVPASRIYDLPWACDGKFKVAQLVCEAFWPDGNVIEQLPRTVARKQFEKLDAMGYKLLSGYEAEFFVVDADTLKPVTDGAEYVHDLELAKNAFWFFDMEQKLRKCGINIETLHTEYAPGQFECSMAPKYGLETIDDMFVFKQASKEILHCHGLKPTFMTRPFAHYGGSSGFHFNHSLWDTDGKCVFYDASKPDRMSDVMRYWVGGIMKHIEALLVLCSPTPNCFRRLHRPWAPGRADWGIDNRRASIRVKNINERCCLIENRLPSAASNPYLVAAGTIAAGIDGIEKKIEPPAEGQTETSPLLPTIEKCLDALESDTDFVNSLGRGFVDWWLAAKRENEMRKFANLTLVENPPEEEMQKERHEYFEYI